MRASAVLMVASVVAGSAASYAQTPSLPKRLNAAALFRQVSPSIVVVTGSEGQGSGVIVGPGMVATNFHVINGERQLLVTHGTRKWKGTVLLGDEDKDVALLSVPGLKAPAAVPRKSDSLQVGETVYAVGAPQGLELSLSQGLISALRPVTDGWLIQTTAPFSPGSSGGGLFDDRGRLLGLTTWFLKNGQNLNFVHPVDWVQGLVAQHKYEKKHPSKPKQLSDEEAEEGMASLVQAGNELLQGGNTAKAREFFELVVKAYSRIGMKEDEHPQAAAAAAEAQFHLADMSFESFDSMTVAGSGKRFEASIKRKGAALEATNNLFAKVFEYRHDDWTLAAMYRRAYGLERFAAAMRAVEPPSEVLSLGEEAADAFVAEVDKSCQPLEKSALDIYETTLKEAERRSIDNEWIQLARVGKARLSRVRGSGGSPADESDDSEAEDESESEPDGFEPDPPQETSTGSSTAQTPTDLQLLVACKVGVRSASRELGEPKNAELIRRGDASCDAAPARLRDAGTYPTKDHVSFFCGFAAGDLFARRRRSQEVLDAQQPFVRAFSTCVKVVEAPLYNQAPNRAQFWNVSLDSKLRVCRSIDAQEDELQSLFEKRRGQRCDLDDQGDHLRFDCGDVTEVVLFSSSACASWTETLKAESFKTRDVTFRSCMKQARAKQPLEYAASYCVCVSSKIGTQVTEAGLAKMTESERNGLYSGLSAECVWELGTRQ